MWVEPSDTALIDTLWADAPADPDALTLYLTAAYGQCVEFAPALAVDAPVPANYRLAQVLQARALQRSTVAGSGDQMGGDGFTVTVFPMDWNVKNLLRPTKGTPVIL